MSLLRSSAGFSKKRSVNGRMYLSKLAYRVIVIISWLYFFQLFPVSGQSMITGVVRNPQGEPLSFASLVINHPGIGTYAGNEGDYVIREVPHGEWTLTVSHVGYQTTSVRVMVDRGTVNVDIILYPSITRISDAIIQAESIGLPDLIRLPSRSSLIDARQLTLTPSTSLTHVLGSVSGVHVQNEFGFFSTSDVSIRGVGSGQTGTLVVIDGVPVNKSDGGSVNWNIIDKDMISFVEVIKGPVSPLFGSNAMGGVINMVTSIPEPGRSVRASVMYGTHNTFEAKASTYGADSIGKLYWKGFIRYCSSDGYINTPEEIILENDSIVVPVYVNEKSAGGIIGYRAGLNHIIELSVNYFEDIRGRGVKIYEESGSNTERDTWQVAIRHQAKLKAWKTSATLYALRENYFRLNEYFSDGEYKLYEVDSKRDDFGIRALAERKTGLRSNVITGFEARSGKVNAKDIYYTSTDLISNLGSLDIVALFLQYNHTMKNPAWKLMAGLRYDLASFHDASFSIDQPSYSIEYFTRFQLGDIPANYWQSVNPKFILEYKPTGWFRQYLAIAKGFRAPVLDDMCRSYKSSVGFRAANPLLNPENVAHIEVGSDLKCMKILQAEISLYHTTGNQFMHPLSTGDSVNYGYTIVPVYQMSNIAMVKISGLELDLSAEVHQRYRFFCNYSFTHALIGRFEPHSAADADLTGKFLTNVPAHKSAAGVVLAWNSAHFTATVKYTGRRWIRDDNQYDNIYLMSDQYDPAVTLDLGIRYALKQFDIIFDIENLLDHQYVNNRGYLSPGRMIFLKLSAHFNKKYT